MTNTTRPPPDFNGIPRPHEARQGRSAIPIIYVGITTDVLILILISALQSPTNSNTIGCAPFRNLVYLFIFFLLPYKEGVSYSIVLLFYFSCTNACWISGSRALFRYRRWYRSCRSCAGKARISVLETE